ncbi:MAG: hypothetical protein IKR38_05615 [Bacteroidales bacterium]|nr:hypothetical protein [Bacteroidales bacterium]
MRKAFHIVALLLVLTLSARAQDADRVRLISAQSAQLIDKDGVSWRKVVGPAKFFHNNTYLICDTALWNVNTNIIDAIGHVRIIQDRTKLTSATLQYVVDDNMAKFRGDLVQLEDADKNTLRTRYLDYNTKDSVAIFQGGAAMRDKDGQVIESQYGTYDSKAKLFVFNESVNMYMDTTFVKTSRLEYRSDLSTAYFGFGTDMWQDDKMLSADDGWYNRDQELFFFRRKVHLLSETQEAWADTMYYYRSLNDVDMLGKVELMDTTRNAYALAGRFQYKDSLNEIIMTREPAVMTITEENGVRDSLYLGADILRMRNIKKCDIPDGTVKASEKRLSDIGGDPVMEYRKKAAEAAAKAAEEASRNDPNRPPEPPKAPGAPSGKPAPRSPAPPGPASKPAAPPVDTSAMTVPADSAFAAPADSTFAAPADSLAAASPEVVEPPKDTTKIAFLWGSKRVRLFRKDMQMVSDSLAYTDLDSLVRLYKDPVFYNEGNKQYAADSIFLSIRNKTVEKANLLSNAFITIQEDPRSYDQIRGAEMVAYFDSSAVLTRFDALGGAASIFYLVEQNALATVNKVESKMIYATFKDGDIERMYYYDNPKNDGYPTVQLPEDERQLKGFRWEPEKKPQSPLDVTTLTPRKSERTSYLARPHTKFTQTDIYFPGYIKKVYRDIALRDSLKVVRAREEQRRKDSIARAEADSTMLAAVDSLAAPADSVAAPAPSDSTSASRSLPPLDSLGVMSPSDTSALGASPQVPDKKALKEAERKRRAEEKAAKRAERQAAREARWAEEDRIYEEKQAARAAKKLEKERAKKLKALRRLEKKARKERRLLEKYIRKEQNKSHKK